MAISATYRTPITSGNPSSLTDTAVAPSGTDRGILVIVEFMDAQAGTTISSVQKGSTSLNVVPGAEIDNSTGSRTRISAIYELENPTTTAEDVTVTFSQVVTNGFMQVVLLEGVHQTNMIGASAEATGNSTNPNVTLNATEANSLRVGGGVHNANDTNDSATPDTGCTERADVVVIQVGIRSLISTVSRTDASTGNVGLGWTSDNSNSAEWAFAAVEILNAAAGAPDSALPMSTYYHIMGQR